MRKMAYSQFKYSVSLIPSRETTPVAKNHSADLGKWSRLSLGNPIWRPYQGESAFGRLRPKQPRTGDNAIILVSYDRLQRYCLSLTEIMGCGASTPAVRPEVRPGLCGRV